MSSAIYLNLDQSILSFVKEFSYAQQDGGLFMSVMHHIIMDTSLHSSDGRALDLKIRGCGFDYRVGQPNSYLLSFG